MTATDFGFIPPVLYAACPQVATSTRAVPTIQLYPQQVAPDHCRDNNSLAPLSGTLTPATTASDCAKLVTSMPTTCTRINYQDHSIYPAPTAREACTRYLAHDYSWSGYNDDVAQLKATDMAFAPDAYYVSDGLASQTFTLGEGDVTEVPVSLHNMTVTPPTFSANISFADPRELPDAAVATITSSCAGDRGYSLPPRSTNALQLKAFQMSTCVYTLNAGQKMTLDQLGSNSVTLHRIDVDDVVVTRSDGSTYTTSGTYELYYMGQVVAGPYPTNTGIDVLPGGYHLMLHATTADGPQSWDQAITL
jgi:hypothetical protein